MGHRQQQAAKTGPTALIVRRKIGAAIKRLAVRKQKTGKRPAALPGKGADGGLAACVDIRALVAVYFYRYKMFVNDFGDVSALVAFPFDDVAPMAPHRADVQQHR